MLTVVTSDLCGLPYGNRGLDGSHLMSRRVPPVPRAMACVPLNRGCSDDHDQKDQKECYPTNLTLTESTCNKRNKPCNTSKSWAHVRRCVVLHIDRFPFSSIGPDPELIWRPVWHPGNHCGWIRTKSRYVAKAAGADPILGVQRDSSRRRLQPLSADRRLRQCAGRPRRW